MIMSPLPVLAEASATIFLLVFHSEMRRQSQLLMNMPTRSWGLMPRFSHDDHSAM